MLACGVRLSDMAAMRAASHAPWSVVFVLSNVGRSAWILFAGQLYCTDFISAVSTGCCRMETAEWN